MCRLEVIQSIASHLYCMSKENTSLSSDDEFIIVIHNNVDAFLVMGCKEAINFGLDPYFFFFSTWHASKASISYNI